MNKTPLPTEFEKMSVQQKFVIIQWLARFPAMTLMVFLRVGLGLRFLNPWGLILTTLFVMVLSGLLHETRRSNNLLIFAIAALTLGLYQWHNRWRELRLGIPCHSVSFGASRLHFLPLPNYFRRERRAERRLDPLLGFGIGFILFKFSFGLGGWVILASGSLCFIGLGLHNQQFHKRMNLQDGLIDSEIQGETFEHFSPPLSQHSKPTQVLPTGLGELKDRINKKTN